MPGKSFEGLTLDEVFDLEAKYSANLGRSVVSSRGLKRNRAAVAASLKKTVVRARKSRKVTAQA